MEKIHRYKAPAAFSHSPYTVNLNQKSEGFGNSSNAPSGPSFPPEKAKASQDDPEAVQTLSTSPITVQPRYRLHSPSNSYSSPKILCSSPSVENTVRSPIYPNSNNGSFYGENSHCSGPSASIQVQSRDTSGNAGLKGTGPYSAGAGGANFNPVMFSIPQVYSGSMNSSRTASQARSPFPDPAPLQGSPPVMLVRGAEYVSPPMAVTGTPPYHALDGLSVQSAPNKVTSPVRSSKASRSYTGARGNGANADTNAHQRRSRQSQHRRGGSVDDSLCMSVSSASCTEEELDPCPNDDLCPLINDRKHQRKYVHTCRLFPCYHGHILRHAKLFRHSPGQIAETEGLRATNGGQANLSPHALGSVNYTSISPSAPNAYKIIVSHLKQSYEIFGDWENVRVHTFKRYLHQVYKIPPTSQVLVLSAGEVLLDDDIESVGHYGVKPESVIVLKRKEDDEPSLVFLNK